MIICYLDLQLPMQSVPITSNVVSSNPAQARCTRYNINVCQWFSLGTAVSSTNKTDYHDMTEILLKVALNINYDTPAYMLVYFISFCNELTPTYRVQSQPPGD
jgi:hypothetical protein